MYIKLKNEIGESMKILITKSNCPKCNQVKEMFDLEETIVLKIKNIDDIGKALYDKVSKKELTFDEGVRALVNLAYSNSFCEAQKRIPLLIVEDQIEFIPRGLKRKEIVKEE